MRNSPADDIAQPIMTVVRHPTILVTTFAASAKKNRLKELRDLSLIHISEPTRPLYISYAVFCLKKKR